MLLWAAFALAAAPLFRLHLPAEPTNLDPHRQKTASSSYLLQNLHHNLLIEREPEGLVPDLAEGCVRENKGRRLVCRLKKNLKWSDGKPLEAADFLRAYRRILDPKTMAYRPDPLLSVKNARAILAGKKPPESLGVAAPDSRTLKFELDAVDPNFEHALANPILAPFREDDKEPTKMATTGPYKIAAWDAGKSLRLTKNPNYPGGREDRPDVEFRFIEDDSTALKLYEKNELDFLRRLPTAYIAKYESSSEYISLPLLRFDYIGFGPRLQNLPKLREALAESLDYDEFQKLLNARGRPGCPGVPDAWFSEGPPPCHTLDLKKARRAMASVNEKLVLKYAFSSLGGEDHRRSAEWQQNQWKKNIGLDVRVEMMENKIFLAKMNEGPTDLFRKGIAADQPTCAAVLAPFTPHHPENFMHFDNAGFNALFEKVEHDPSDKVRSESCEKAIRLLVERHAIIPLGKMSFVLLAKPTFTGWRLNSLNQLDLSDLHAKAPPASL